MHNSKIIVVLGPTASGKSSLAIKLAKKYNGEIISADSRQIYKGMDIGTGKVPKSKIKSQKLKVQFKNKKNIYWSGGVTHYMIDIVSPKTDYNAAKFQKTAQKIIEDILRRGKLPIICGGTGFWIASLVDNTNFPEVKPDWKLRNKLRNYSTTKLFSMLKNLDKERAKNIDKNNPVRLIRAIEIARALGKVPKIGEQLTVNSEQYKYLQIGIAIPKEKLHERIKIRLDKRFKQGMIQEVKNLHFKNKVSWKKLESFGLEYKYIALYLQKKISKEELKEKLFQEIKNFSKRQMTWFKKDWRIKWLENFREIDKKTKNFLNLTK
jgi:tRNA dimethylallyltransferase